MDMIEFLNTLSEKGKNIVKKYLPSFKKKQTFSIVFSDKSCVKNYNEDEYIICINTKENKSIEYIFLHEFFHCVQNEESFPKLYSNNDDYINFSNDLSSYILDYNIRSRLEKYSYFDHMQEMDIMYKTLLKYFTILSNNKQRLKTYTVDSISYGMSLAMLNISIHNNIKLKRLLLLVRKVDLKTYAMYIKFYQYLTKYDFNSKEGVYKIFEAMIRDLRLDSYISIKT